MEQASTTELAIQLEGRTVLARPRPEDQDRLAELMAGGRSILSIEPTALDTEGHGLGDEIAVDVEGHALTLRLPTIADATALRRALAVGALTATVALGGAAVASMSQADPAPAAPVVAPAVDPAPDLATWREHRLAETMGQPYAAGGGVVAPDTSAGGNSETHEKRSGPLEFNP